LSALKPSILSSQLLHHKVNEFGYTTRCRPLV
jgi:hypothetical protein